MKQVYSAGPFAGSAALRAASFGVGPDEAQATLAERPGGTLIVDARIQADPGLLAALRPPAGWVTDIALGTTYSLELPVALAAMVALLGGRIPGKYEFRC